MSQRQFVAMDEHHNQGMTHEKSVIAFCLANLFSVSAFALVPSGNDATTRPNLYFLKNTRAIDSQALLPPPPEMGSIAFLTIRQCMGLLCTTERGKQAAEDANLSAVGVANAFSGAFGSPITARDTPELHKLLTNMIEDAGELAKNGSYPSGHTSIGWATALVLAEINPQQQLQKAKDEYAKLHT